MGSSLSAGPYPHYPFVGKRPMKYPYTLAASFAQFPFVYYYRYTPIGKPFLYGQIFINLPFFYKLEQWSYSPSNVKEWEERRKQWYTRKLPPEWDLF